MYRHKQQQYKYPENPKKQLPNTRISSLITPISSLLTPNSKKMSYIHISTLKRILQSPEPVDIALWTKSGEIQVWHNCISLRYDFYKGTRRMKMLGSNQIRQLRDVCIFQINESEVII
jgi:hypothetical protein